MNMTISPLTKKQGKKSTYVMFQDGEKQAEILIPDCKVVASTGFEDEEIAALLLYVKGNQESIMEKAKGVSPFKAMMK